MEDTLKINYHKEMTMEELVNAINNSNNILMTGFGAMIRNQSDLLLGEIKQLNTKVSSLESDMQKIKNHFGIK